MWEPRHQDNMKNDSIVLYSLKFICYIFNISFPLLLCISCCLPINCAHRALSPRIIQKNWSHSHCSASAKHGPLLCSKVCACMVQVIICTAVLGHLLWCSDSFALWCKALVFNNWWGLCYCHTYWATSVIRLASDWDMRLCWFLHGLCLRSDEAKLETSITSTAGGQSSDIRSNGDFQSDMSFKMVPFFVGEQQN